MSLALAEAPSHVPEDLVRRWPLSGSRTPLEDPFTEIIPRLHDGPSAIYALEGHHQGGPAWAFRREAENRAIFMDTETFASHGAGKISMLIGEEWDVTPVEVDPPAHSAYRILLNPLFTPKRLGEVEATARAVAGRLVDRMLEKGSADLIADFCLPFPVSVFLGLMGLPLEEMDRFVDYEQDFMRGADLDTKFRAMSAIVAALREAIAERQARPADDFISFLVGAEMDGRKLTPQELIGICVNFYLGGLDTVTSLLGWNLRHLAQAPDDQRRMRDDPALRKSGMEELIRAFAPVTNFRVCTRQTEFGGVTIMPGESVMVATSFAARDPEFIDRPNEVIIDRKPVQHLTFGAGPHHCIGVLLARRELHIAFEEILPRLRDFRLDAEAPPAWRYGPVLGLDRLPLVWGN